MKFFKNIAIIVILFTIIAIASLNIIATDYDGSYNSYNITLEYPGYFIDEVTVSCPSGYKPDWDNIITYGSSVLTDIKISAGDRDVVCIQINDPNNTFYGSTFKLKHEGHYVLIYDLVSDNALYYLELVDSGNTFTIYGRNGVNYYFDKPNNTTTWFEYISNLESPHRDMFYFVEDFVFFNDYALKYENEFVRISDRISFTYYEQSYNAHGHDWVNTRDVIQSPTCQRPLIIEQECTICGSRRLYTDYVIQESSHEFVYRTGVSATCYDSGYTESQCTICGEINFEVLSQLNHRYNSVTCERDGICIRCGYIGYKALGHDLDWKGECTRCDYKKDIIGGWWNNDVLPGFNNVGKNIGNFFNSLGSGIKDTSENIFEFVLPGEDEKGLLTNLFGDENSNKNGNVLKTMFNVLIAIIFLAIIVIIICKVAPYVVNFFGSLKKKKRKRRKRRKKELKNK